MSSYQTNVPLGMTTSLFSRSRWSGRRRGGAARLRLRRRLVLVVAAHEVHGRALVAAERRAIEDHQRADELLGPAGVARVGVEHLARLVADEGAEARQLRPRPLRRRLGEVVEDLAGP